MPAHRKSIELHDLHGTKPQRAADTSHVKAGRPKFPKDLDKSLRPIFKRLCSLLQERRALTSADGELIRLYVHQFDRHTRNAAQLRQEGEVCQYTRLDSHGQPHLQYKTNLRLKIVVEAEKQMAGILSQLGLTPLSKDRVKLPPQAEDKPLDLLEEYLKGKSSPIVFPHSTTPQQVNPADMAAFDEEPAEDEATNDLETGDLGT